LLSQKYWKSFRARAKRDPSRPTTSSIIDFVSTILFFFLTTTCSRYFFR